MTIESKARDEMIIADYREGKRIRFLAHEHGLSEKRIQQILLAAGLKLRPAGAEIEVSGLSPYHERLGDLLINYMYDQGYTEHDLANELGMGIPQLKKIMRGTHDVTLEQVMTIVVCTNIDLRKDMFTHGS